MRFAILGAGGVGGYYGGVLARAGHQVAVLARGAHLEAIRRDGLRVRMPEGEFAVHPEASDDVAELGSADVAIVAVKSYSLDAVAPAARALAERGAAVLPLLNGIGAADALEAAGVPRTAILGGLTIISAARIAPGVVERRSPFQRIVLGELDGTLSARAERIAAALREAGIEARASSEIRVELWRKLIFLAPMAAVCGLARTSIGPVRDAPLGRVLIERAVREAIAVARAQQIALAPDEDARAVAALDALQPAIKPSLLLDLERGGPTELDALSGTIAALGRGAAIETPVHDTAVAAISASLARRE